ncbi:MAG: hypothetical protein LUQ01_04620, partial [Methanolinea sp.]|nr:hypothetical protein [Methanolinea sp.]
MKQRRVLQGVFLLLVLSATAGCLSGIPGFGPPVVYPGIVPMAGGTMPAPPVYSFPFQDGIVRLDIPVDASVYAGARAADKSARIFDRSVREEEWRAGIYRSMVQDPAQDDFYEILLSKLREERDRQRIDQDQYAELLSVFVQAIPYETQNLSSPRFPVEIYVDGKGDCDDKSLLLAGLLSRENYKTALLYFEPERHMAVGLGCEGGGYAGSGYAYIETTNVSLIGVVPDELQGGIRITSSPVVIPIGNGTSGYRRCRETAELRDAVNETEQILETRGPELQEEEIALGAMKGAMDTMKTGMDAAYARRDYPSYNSGVTAYNAMVMEYNQRLAEYRTMVTKFNRLAGIHNYI